MTHGNVLKFGFQCPSTELYSNLAMLISLHTVVAALGLRAHRPQSPKYLLSGPFTETFTDPWTKYSTSLRCESIHLIKLISEKNVPEPCWGQRLGEVWDAEHTLSRFSSEREPLD